MTNLVPLHSLDAFKFRSKMIDEPIAIYNSLSLIVITSVIRPNLIALKTHENCML